MVDFNTRIFSEDDGKIIGAEITVYSDSGNKIGNISVADAETLEEMQAQLAVIDETYFTEARLQAILANTNENTPINATTLSGFLSSDFAKVSQLSNYAPLSHNHTKNQITDLYNYQITANKYNVDIDTDVTITVKVTNQLGNPVVGVTVPVLKDNQTWRSGTTGVNGTFSLTYTADTWGLVMFSASSSNCQVDIQGWRILNTGGFVFRVNGHQAQLRFVISDEDTPVKTVFEAFGGYTIPVGYRPAGQVVGLAYSSNDVIIAVQSNGQILRRSMNQTSTIYCGVYGQLEWEY